MKLTIDLGPHVGADSCIARSLGEGCCAYLRSTRFGTKWVCGLFDRQSVEQADPTLPLKRLPECLAAEDRKERRRKKAAQERA